MAKKRGDNEKTRCPVETALGVIGGRWKGVVVFKLLGGPLRFSQLRRLLPNCSQRMLTLQLRELEEDGLLTRTVFAEVPPRVEYELTELGKSLSPLMLELYSWGERFKRSATPKASERSA